MTDKTPEFTIDHDHEEDEDHFEAVRKEVKDLRLEKLNTRVTLITIIVPILIGAILYLGYMDISSKVKSVYSTGSNEVQTLAKDLDSRFSTLSIQISKIEEGFNKQYNALNVSVLKIGNSLGGLEEEIKRHKKDIDYLAVKRKTFETDIASLVQDTQALKGDLSKASERLAKDIAELSFLLNNMKKELIGFKTELASLAESKVGKDTLNAGVKQLNDKIDGMSKNFEKKMKAMEAQISASKSAASPATSTAREPAKPNAPSNTVDMIKVTPEAPGTSTPTATDGVIEQEISE